jgi:hypothetical protein
MTDTIGRVRNATAALRLNVLIRMLRSTLQKWPSARLQVNSQGGFGVSLDAETSLHIQVTGRLPDEDLRALLALFANWVSVDPDLLRRGIRPDGSSLMVRSLRGAYFGQSKNSNGGGGSDHV